MRILSVLIILSLALSACESGPETYKVGDFGIQVWQNNQNIKQENGIFPLVKEEFNIVCIIDDYKAPFNNGVSINYMGNVDENRYELFKSAESFEPLTSNFDYRYGIKNFKKFDMMLNVQTPASLGYRVTEEYTDCDFAGCREEGDQLILEFRINNFEEINSNGANERVRYNVEDVKAEEMQFILQRTRRVTLEQLEEGIKPIDPIFQHVNIRFKE